MSLLRAPYEDWKPGEDRIRHNERGQRIEVWRWSQKHTCWELIRTLPRSYAATTAVPR